MILKVSYIHRLVSLFVGHLVEFPTVPDTYPNYIIPYNFPLCDQNPSASGGESYILSSNVLSWLMGLREWTYVECHAGTEFPPSA